MAWKVVLSFALPGLDFGEAILAPLGAEVIKGVFRTEEDLVNGARDADAIIGISSIQPYNRRVLSSLPQCRIVAITGIGYENVDLEAATDLGIAVTNVPDYCLDEVSDHALALMLALNRKLFQLQRAVKEEGLWTADMKMRREVLPPMQKLRGSTLGIVGFGNIGRALALKARGLGMRVLAYDPFVLTPVMETMGVEAADLDTLLRESDFVSVHANLTPENRRLFNYERFQKMKRTAYFINTARGGLVDEADLVRALKEKLIAGAGLDVSDPEPVPRDSPLLQMDNVILTGHTAQFSNRSEAELWQRPMQEVVRALKGQWPRYVVNPEVKAKYLQKWGKKA